MFTVLIIVAVIVIICVVFLKKKGVDDQATFVYIGRDLKNRPVFKRIVSNGTSSMWKIIENGKIEMDISDFNADRGKACFTSENFRRYLVALEKGLVQARDNNGEFERNSNGLVIYKDNNGNYVDNPDNYYP
jgi:hypothetical protein